MKKIGRITSIEELLEPVKDPKAFFDLVLERHNILKDSWLTQTGHKRPEMKKGLPLTEANVKAADFMKKKKELTP